MLNLIEVINLLFCRHKYTLFTATKIYSTDSDGWQSSLPTGVIIIQLCEKCGKIKQTKVKACGL